MYDDDAEPLRLKFGIATGKMWLDHPGMSNLKFYTDRKCTTEIKISQIEPFILKPKQTVGEPYMPDTYIFIDPIYMRAENMASGGYQKSGDLRLMVQPTTTDPHSGEEIFGPEMEVGKMKLTIVAGLGADKHHRAVVDYIKENNAKHCLRWFDANQKSIYAGYIGKETLLDGVDSRHRFEDIHDTLNLEADAIINGNYAGSRTGTTGCAGWPDWQDGEIYENGNWNFATSHVTGANGDRQGYWKTSIDWNNAKFIHTSGRGIIPVDNTHGGIAGLATRKVDGDLGLCIIGRTQMTEGDQIMYIGDIRRDEDLVSFMTGMGVGSGDAFWGELDGGGSTSLAIASPADILFVPLSPGRRHGGIFQPLFKSRNDLVGAYLKIKTTRFR